MWSQCPLTEVRTEILRELNDSNKTVAGRNPRPPYHHWCGHVQFFWLNSQLYILLPLPPSHSLPWRDPQEVQLWGEQAAGLGIFLSACLNPFECQQKLGVRKKQEFLPKQITLVCSFSLSVLFPLCRCNWIILTEFTCVTLNPWAAVENRQESKATFVHRTVTPGILTCPECIQTEIFPIERRWTSVAEEVALQICSEGTLSI